MSISEPKRTFASIDGYLIDCLLTVEHVFDNEVTEFPVESGPDVTDNIRPRPIQVTMECIVSNSPIGAIATARANAIAGEFSGPADEAYERLLTIRDNRALVPIRTGLQEFKNMALKSLGVPQSSETGDAIKFTVVWIQVQLVENKRFVRVAIPMATGGGAVNKPAIDATGHVDTSRMVDTNGASGGHWWDPAIGFWRFGVLHNGIAGVTTSPTGHGLFDSIMVSPVRPWDLIKGRPIFVSYDDWHKKPLTDAEAMARKKALDADPATSFLSQAAINKYIVQPIILLAGDEYFERDASGAILNA